MRGGYLILLGLLALAPGRADGYALRLTPDGQLLRWPEPTIPWRLPPPGSLDVAHASAVAAAERAFAAWSDAECTGVTFLRETGTVEATNLDGGPADGVNAVRWREHDWPGAADEIARTSIAYRKGTGEILDVDIDLNGEYLYFTIADDPARTEYDIESALVHEIGHLLGLDDSEDPDSAMGRVLARGDLGRGIDDDDVDAVCAVYPRQRMLHSLEVEGACQVAAAARRGGVAGGPGAAILVVLAALGLARPLRRRGRRATALLLAALAGGAAACAEAVADQEALEAGTDGGPPPAGGLAVHGRVLDFESCASAAGCRPVVGATVWAHGGALPGSGPTGLEGAFALTGLGAGAHLLRVETAGVPSGRYVPTLNANPVVVAGSDVYAVDLYVLSGADEDLLGGIARESTRDFRVTGGYIGQVIDRGESDAAVDRAHVDLMPVDFPMRYVNVIPRYAPGEPVLRPTTAGLTSPFGLFAIASLPGPGAAQVYVTHDGLEFEGLAAPVVPGLVSVGLHVAAAP